MAVTVKVFCAKCNAVSPIPKKQWDQATTKQVQLLCPVCNKGRVSKVS